VLCDSIDLPDELVAAQEQGRLAIFVGAGVSMGPPSNLPSFKQLTERIAENTGHDPTEPYDVFLGTLADAGVNVHTLCQEIIRNSVSSPAPLHEYLLRVSREPNRSRIITTNFDRHFSTAALQLGWDIPEYRAPALPVGHDFNGIVYLHGAIDDEPRRLVLSDSDFGRAYLTQGWASVFLRAVFAEFAVLFVGYSHRDPPIRYLARGLDARGYRPRYAVIGDGDVAEWRPLGITPIIYPLQTGPDAHGALTRAIGRWAEITELRPIDIEAQMRTILTAPRVVELDRIETDFIKRCLSKEETAQYFVRYANDWRWVEWLYREGLLARYLNANYAQATRVERFLGLWLGAHLASELTGRGLWLINEYGGQMGGWLRR
jgi:hypothetical protein